MDRAGVYRMQLAVLTSTETRHRYFANALHRAFSLVAVGYQDTRYDPATPNEVELDAPAAELVKRHFAERIRQEAIHFGADAKRLVAGQDLCIRSLTPATLGAEETVDWLRDRNVDAIAVFGTGLIKAPLLDVFAGRILNMHLGLSPYYRGTATNFYPLLYGEPEYVGATIHLVDAGIDSGPIVHHARPCITAADLPHTVGCKAILAGIEKMIQALRELQEGRLKAIPQWEVPNPKLCLRRDYRHSQVVELYDRVEGGLFREYPARKHRVENAMRLID